MTTFASSRPSTIPTTPQPRPTSARRTKKDTPRTDIWTSLLRSTRQAQARSRTHNLDHRSLLILGGSAPDQRNFVENYVARPPPPTPPTANRREEPRKKGEVRLSNRFAYGYGHVTLFSPPQGQGGSVLLGGEAEEVARVECHCFAGAAEKGYEGVLRKVLAAKSHSQQSSADIEEERITEGESEGKDARRPSVAILMSWQKPWEFLDILKRWLVLLSQSLLPEGGRKDENPMEVLKEFGVGVTVVLQHVEAQEVLERENYKDDTFDYISQCLRTCILPLGAGLVYTPSTPLPSQPGAPLSEVQKVVYASLGLDVASLQPRAGVRPGSSSGIHQKTKDDLQPRHNVVDRMAIVVPSGWDSVGKIRLLSETFSPEIVMEGWAANLAAAVSSFNPPSIEKEEPVIHTDEANTSDVLEATGGAMEMYSSQPSPDPSPVDGEPPMSPSKMAVSATATYERTVQDPNAHKASKAAKLEVTTKPEQEFLAEMRAQLQQFEAHDAERQRKEGGSSVHSTAGALQQTRDGSGSAGTSSALSDLGDVSFNVGGVSYNTVSAEAAIERLKRPQHPSSSSGGTESPTVSTPRSGTPRPPKREGREGTPVTSGGKTELQTEKLEEYFASLMKRSGGGSNSSTPSKPPPSS
ncbi:uncharacterized protein LTR77_004869 [Saxophila tyrrhenica]|uniref:Uncharacterized protein n=1 Tax=Saxophila tyrrhenica TaxID=1690608 RepID=A0AAV9PDG3_9PEZI|nr:hypothetical protein LTR77_004869 [Saxophila tyrrhenica]